MTQEILKPPTGSVQDVTIPSSSNKDLNELLKEVIKQLEDEIAHPKGGNIEMFELIFKLLVKFGIPNTVFQTGNLKCKDKKGNEETKTFIFSGPYELEEGKDVWYDVLPDNEHFDAVVIGEFSKVSQICDSENEG